METYLAAAKVAAMSCGYRDIEDAVGSHGAPVLMIHRFAGDETQDACLVAWSKNPARGEQALARAAFEAAADAVIAAHVGKEQFAGNVLVAFNGRPVLHRATGLADRTWNAASTPDTVYRIGSTTKTFTAVAVLQLVETGKVALDTPIRAYLPDLPESWSAITVRHLLAHESGIPELLSSTNSFTRLVRVDRTPKEAAELVAGQPLAFAPGSAFAYSNTNYFLLGRLIETVSGQAYEAYVAQHILAPAGMTRTGYFDPGAIVPRAAAGYIVEGAAARNMFYISPGMTYASGNLYSTAGDLLAFDRALHEGDLLKPQTRAVMLRDRGHGYGLGVYLDKAAGEPMVGHPGTLPGFLTDYQRFTGFPLTIVVLSNTYPGKVEAITRALAAAFVEHCGKADAAARCGLE